MIYSTNRTASLGELSVDVNESYFGIGAMSFMEESAQDELAIFESAIKSDIDEVLIGESSYELTALNEGFVDNAAKKIKELMEKFISWIESVIRSAWAKLNQLLNRDNAKFAAAARKQIIKIKNKNFKYKGKALKPQTDVSEIGKKAVERIKSVKDLYDSIGSGMSAEQFKTRMEQIKENSDKLSVSDSLKELVDENAEGGLELVQRHLEMLEKLGKSEMKNIRKAMDKAKKDAADIAKDAKSLADKTSSDKDATEDAKKEANLKSEAAALFKSYIQRSTTYQLQMIKAQAKICRAVVAKAMGAPTNEGAEYDEELTDAMIEAAEYEYDSAMEEMSEGSKCEECDDSDDDFDDDDMD